MARPHPPSAHPRLPAAGAFVVQLLAEGRGDRRRFEGRVEHVTSGRAARFTSSGELLEFLEAPLSRRSIDDARAERARRRKRKEKNDDPGTK